MMGTEVSVYLWCANPEQGLQAIDAVFEEAARIDRLMSTYRDDSEISKINREAALRAVPVSSELFELIVQSLQVSALTHGAFDISYASVGQHYDFRLRRRPNRETLAQESANIDFRLVVLDDAAQTVRFQKRGVRIDLGGIAKGYVVERAIALLKERGVRHAIVTAGGDSRLLGDRRGRPWIVGIRDPRQAGEVTISLPLHDEAVSTSGDYERYFDEGGVRYHHIIHPRTGEPAGGVRSATVIGPNAVMTDALSTSVFVMGVDKGLRLIARMADYESVVIDDNGRVYFSDGLAQPDP
jgi:thiamine biosynthesis lipoprotein